MTLAVTLCLALTVLGSAAAWAAPATTVTRGPTDRPRIALTFDDNYQPGRALAVIDVLERYRAPATMFVIGSGITAYPSITKAIADGGFEVGDHSQSHKVLTKLSWSPLLREIGAGTAAFNRATGRRTAPLLRPPYGATNSTVAAAAGEKGFLYVVLWDVDTNDWKGLSAATIRDHVLSHAHNGAIVLMHMSAPHTAAALPGIISGLRDRGYELVTVSALLKGNRRFLDLAEATDLGRAVLRMVDAGYMSGYDADYFGPTDPMTRGQLAKVAVLTAGLHTPEVEKADSPTFVDVPPKRDAEGKVIAYPFDYVEEAAASGILSGRAGESGQVFSPGVEITRGQLAQVVARMARELKGYPVDYGTDGPTFSDVPDLRRRRRGPHSQVGPDEGLLRRDLRRVVAGPAWPRSGGDGALPRSGAVRRAADNYHHDGAAHHHDDTAAHDHDDTAAGHYDHDPARHDHDAVAHNDYDDHVDGGPGLPALTAFRHTFSEWR